jgi:hypothetical protein
VQTSPAKPLTTWVILLAATALSYLAWVDSSQLPAAVTGSFVIVVAMAKAWLIGMRYMELETAIWPLRLAYSAWIIVVGLVLLAMFAIG